ncbi:MAG: bifunctional hydroxymethylpyrimidine kinase/phosphomethylpyrimidine kinase [Candidatus Lokiarchaeota archaeon]|nr:bifunctional hydroxymethylpyrimidine kinase/phosphomethylpyrimidine kinase [Candidatus Lokiarchaeota archaeon]
MKPFCLTIAGSDPTSGAGIQADIRTFDRIGVHPFSAITAITYQTASEFHGFKSLSEELRKQLDAILNVYPIKYVKIGMIPDIKSLDVIKNTIIAHNLTVILDPVSISSVGERLSSEGLEHEIERDLFPLVTVLTPNLEEASYFSNIELENQNLNDLELLKDAAKAILKKMFVNQKISKIEKAVVIKSAGMDNDSVFDLVCVSQLIDDKQDFIFRVFKKPKVSFKGNIHGTGCVFSSAITAYLSLGNSILKSIEKSEHFFDDRFLNFIELPQEGKILDLTLDQEQIKVINQIKEIYHFISSESKFSMLIPEVRMNISGSLPNAVTKKQIAGIEGRITIVGGYPKASGEIKFGVTDHTARLILEAKKFDKSINFVLNLKYSPKWIKLLQEKTDLILQEIVREHQPKKIMTTEESTMQWLIKKSIKEIGRIPDIIWDKGSIGKEAIIRVFAKDSKDMINKLQNIIELIEDQ